MHSVSPGLADAWSDFFYISWRIIIKLIRSTNMLVLCYDSVKIEMHNAIMIDNRVKYKELIMNSKKLQILLAIWIKTRDLIWIPLYGLNFFLQKLWIQRPWQFNWYKMTSVKAAESVSFRNYCMWIFLFYKKLHMTKLSLTVKLAP